jgi:hypothetical protein
MGLILNSCESESSEVTEQLPIIKTEKKIIEKIHNYNGIIGTERNIEMQLIINDKVIVGNYMDRRTEMITPIKGVLRDGNQAELSVYEPSGDVIELFIGTIEKDKITGEWFDKTVTVETKSDFSLMKKTSIVTDDFINKIKGTYEYEVEDYTSTIVIEPINKQVAKVQMSVTYGSCTGDIQNEAYIYDTQHINLYDKDDCFLNLYFNENSISVTETHCMYHHGFGCIFEGKYRKISNELNWIKDS